MALGLRTDTQWLQSLSRFGTKPGLERTSKVLAALGNPEKNLRFFHVAGTNGKGSVCAFLTSLLSQKQRVGTFTSPAFEGYRGRFVICGESMPEDVFDRLAKTVRQTAEAVTKDDPLTEFEALTVMAIVYFSNQAVDAVVWETGLGGRYDTTNVVSPVMTAITNVGLDHTEVLGDTIRAIAHEKAGIAKPGIPMVTAATGEALDVIKHVAQTVDAPVFVRGGAFNDVPLTPDGSRQAMHYRGIYHDMSNVRLGLYGEHQCANAAVAFCMYELAAARSLCKPLLPGEVRQALESTAWPGRFEVFHYRGETVVLDGAHNADGARQFAKTLRGFSRQSGISESGWTMVVGVLGDKDVDAMLEEVLPLAASVIVAQPKYGRAKKAELLSKHIMTMRNDIPVRVIPSIADAMDIALNAGAPVCCWGSLYTVHEARQAMKKSEELLK